VTRAWLRFSVTAAVAAAAVVSAARPARADTGDTADVLAHLEGAARCRDKGSPLRAWCPATGWERGKAAPLRRGFLVGITVAVAPDGDGAVDDGVVGRALIDRVTFVVLQIDRDGPQWAANLRDVQPSGDDEERMLADALFQVAAVLKGKAARVTLAPELRAFAAGLRGTSTRALTRGKHGWTWRTEHNDAELRKVGSVWVVIEAPRDGSAGRFVTVLTDRVR